MFGIKKFLKRRCELRLEEHIESAREMDKSIKRLESETMAAEMLIEHSRRDQNIFGVQLVIRGMRHTEGLLEIFKSAKERHERECALLKKKLGLAPA